MKKEELVAMPDGKIKSSRELEFAVFYEKMLLPDLAWMRNGSIRHLPKK